MNDNIREKEQEQREKFRNILVDLAENQNILSDPNERYNMYIKLEDLYWNQEFRHYYSDIFVVLMAIVKDPNKNINVLGQNIELILKNYKGNTNQDDNGKYIDITDNIKKLYDHVNLDISRINYSDSQDRLISGKEIENRITSQNAVIDELMKKSNQIEEALKMNEEKSNNMQRDYISILGIFASIIIAFVGGITFSTSVLETMASVNIFRLILTIDLLAFVLINTIFMLLKFLMIMSNKDIKELKSVWVGLNVTIAIIAVLVSVSCVIALYINPDFFNEFTSYVYQSQNSEMLHDK